MSCPLKFHGSRNGITPSTASSQALCSGLAMIRWWR